MCCKYVRLLKEVERERETEVRLRAMDTHEVVAEVHRLEDRISTLEEMLELLGGDD